MKMPRPYKIEEAQIAEIKKARKTNKDKRVDKRLRAVELRVLGYKNSEIAEKVESNAKVVSRWICKYFKEGINALKRGKFGGNRRNLTLEEERKFIDEFKEKAEKGLLVTVKEIKIAYCKKIGHKCGKGQIYRVLARQGWRKIVPRKEHPKKATPEAIEASKKLTFG